MKYRTAVDIIENLDKHTDVMRLRKAVHQMNDNDIIKALECHIGKDKGRCKHCAFTVEGCDCLSTLHFALSDLINRQKAEIERLQAEYNDLVLSELELNKPFMDFVNKEKSEAIKEFAERVKKEAALRSYGTIWESDIDNLVKEMTENDFKE